MTFIGLNSNAQNIQVITPENAASSAQEIKSLFGEKIRVSDQDISNFYLQHWSENMPFNAEYSQPKAAVNDINNDFVAFEWDHIPSSNVRYVVNYLRLSNNSSATFSTESNYIKIMAPNDLYLVTFQAWFPGGKGPLGIIIIEKPLEFQEKNCDCPSYYPIWTDNFSDVNPLVYENWNTFNTYQKYFVEVDFHDGPYASFVANITFGPGGPEIVSINPTCMTNVAYNYSGTYLYMHEPGNTSATLGVFGFFTNATSIFGPPQFSFNMDTYAMAFYDKGKVYVHKCKKIRPREEALNNPIIEQKNYLKTLNNPFQSQTKIEYSLQEQDQVSITLFDANGKQVKVLKNQVLTDAGIHQLNIDGANLSNGVYFCILKTSKETHSLKLLKAS